MKVLRVINKFMNSQYLIVRPAVHGPISDYTKILFEGKEYFVGESLPNQKELHDYIARNGLYGRNVILKIEGLSKVDVNVNITFSDSINK